MDLGPHSLRQLAGMFRMDDKTVAAALKKAGHSTGKGKKFFVWQLYEALTKQADTKGAMQTERLKKIRLENELLQQEIDEGSGRLVSVASMIEWARQFSEPIRSSVLAMAETLGPRCNPTDPEHSTKEIREWTHSFLRLLHVDFSKVVSSTLLEEEGEDE